MISFQCGSTTDKSNLTDYETCFCMFSILLFWHRAQSRSSKRTVGSGFLSKEPHLHESARGPWARNVILLRQLARCGFVLRHGGLRDWHAALDVAFLRLSNFLSSVLWGGSAVASPWILRRNNSSFILKQDYILMKDMGIDWALHKLRLLLT